MIENLNFDLIYSIIKFLPNHEIMEFIYLNKDIYKMFDKNKLIEFMNFREHPIVFNSLDNYCVICNQGLIFLDDEINSNVIICNHR